MENKEKQGQEKLDIKGLNLIIKLCKNMLKIIYVLAIILGIYGFIILGKELGIFKTIVTILKVLSPLFIGIVIAWLFSPLVNFLTKKKVKRGLAVAIVYVVLITAVVLILGAIIPTLYKQIQDFAAVIPSIFDKIRQWLNAIFKSLGNINGLNIKDIQTNLYTQIEGIGKNLTSDLPKVIISGVSAVFSGLGNILIGLIIGFFLLLSFDNMDSLIGFLPKKIRIVTSEVLQEIDGALRTFVTGSLLDCLFIFIVTSIGLYFTGLKAPLLFGLFCGITNVIPYAGPYIGGFPAVVVGFSQGITTGIATLVVIVVIQFLEGNFLQPVILSKTTKLHPITIILGLLVFGYLWGILGMLISTPLIAAVKAVVLYFDKKYDILKFN